MKRKILIVEDNVSLSQRQKDWFEQAGYDAMTAMNEPAARALIRKHQFDLILSDVRLPEGNGISLLEWLKKEKRDIPFIITTEYVSVPDVVRTIKLGAKDYLPKPVHREHLLELAEEIFRPLATVRTKPKDLFKRTCPKILEVERYARLVAPSDMSVLILGANGTGKESVAQSIHENSGRVGMLFSFGSESPDVPPIGPSWFLRDIIILTLLTPLLARIKILLLPALLLFFSFCNMAPDPLVTLSVGSCAFYLLGVVLSSRRIDDIHLVLNKKFGVVFCVSILVSSAMVLLHSAGILSLWTETVAGMLLGVMLIMYAGIWMEKRLPGVAARIALLAPACFLTFMLHLPIYECLPYSMKFGAFSLFTPLLAFTAIVLFYFALKRFTPFLLPYLAHVKRPSGKPSA